MEKLIYVHIARLGKSQDDCLVGSDNDWYLIKQGEGVDGVELTPAFEGVSQPNPYGVARMNATCKAIGSCIYVIGGSSINFGSEDAITRKGSKMIYCIDTCRPKDGWITCCTLPFSHRGGHSANVDDQWLCVFGGNRLDYPYPPYPWGFIVNVNDGEVRNLTPPDDLDCYPIISTCLSRGTLNAYMFDDGTLYKLDCKNNTWTAGQKNLHYPSEWLTNCSTVVDGGILYVYDAVNLIFNSYDICKGEELFTVDLPCTFWFAHEQHVELIVLSKNRFCIVWDWVTDYNELLICFSRFSVRFHDGEFEIDLEEKESFPVDGFKIVNVVAVDPN